MAGGVVGIRCAEQGYFQNDRAPFRRNGRAPGLLESGHIDSILGVVVCPAFAELTGLRRRRADPVGRLCKLGLPPLPEEQ